MTDTSISGVRIARELTTLIEKRGITLDPADRCKMATSNPSTAACATNC
jgi:hypothetical protein